MSVKTNSDALTVLVLSTVEQYSLLLNLSSHVAKQSRNHLVSLSAIKMSVSSLIKKLWWKVMTERNVEIASHCAQIPRNYVENIWFARSKQLDLGDAEM